MLRRRRRHRALTAFRVAAAVLALASARAHAQGVMHTVLGHASGDFFGGSCAGAGDVDADGTPDYIVGSPGDDATAPNAGGAFVHSGRTGELLLAIHGEHAGDRLGISVAGAGDLDGDGHADLVVGAHRSDVGGLDAGQVKAISGSTGAELYSVNGAAGEFLGMAVAGAGDVDGDGTPDLLAGAPFSDAGAADGGRVCVLSGVDGHALLVVAGTAANGQLGTAVAGVGDIDGDGAPELIAGAPVASGPTAKCGRVLLISSLDGSVLRTFTGDAAHDSFGASVAAAGDMDGDGRGDLLVGARYPDGGGLDAGLVRAYSGIDGRVLHTWLGTSAGDEFSLGLAGVGDVDGDGTPDVAVGAWADDDNGPNSGSAATFSGATGELLWIVTGDLPIDELGWAVAGAGDVNGDGHADVVAGLPGADALGEATGGARLYSGACGSAITTGAGCAGSGGFVPSLALSGCLAAGGTVTLALDDALGGALSLLVIGPLPGSLPLKGCTLLVAPPFVQLVLLLPGSGAGAGALDLTAALPPGAVGLTLALQCLVADTGVPNLLAST
jgi:hypothetical protein